MMDNVYNRDSSIRHKLKSSLCCFSIDNGDLYYNNLRTPKSPRSPCRKKSPTGIFSRIGRKSRRPSHSADFSYDPFSYALNFEDDIIRTDEDDFPVRDFSSRLKPSQSPPSHSSSDPTSPPPSADKRPATAAGEFNCLV